MPDAAVPPATGHFDDDDDLPSTTLCGVQLWGDQKRGMTSYQLQPAVKASIQVPAVIHKRDTWIRAYQVSSIQHTAYSYNLTRHSCRVQYKTQNLHEPSIYEISTSTTPVTPRMTHPELPTRHTTLRHSSSSVSRVVASNPILLATFDVAHPGSC